MPDLLLKSEEHVKEILHDFMHAQVRIMSEGFTDIIEVTTEIRDSVLQRIHHGAKILTDWPWFYEIIGTKCLWELNDAPVPFRAEEFASFLFSKHKNYGASPILTWRELGILIRIDTKCQRIQNLSNQQDPDWGDESAYDNLADILGYCILGQALVEYMKERNE